jgi:hypothetical protein
VSLIVFQAPLTSSISVLHRVTQPWSLINPRKISHGNCEISTGKKKKSTCATKGPSQKSPQHLLKVAVCRQQLPAAAPAAKRTPNPAFMKGADVEPRAGRRVVTSPAAHRDRQTTVGLHQGGAIGLQDATNKRNINADAKLKAVFGKPQSPCSKWLA